MLDLSAQIPVSRVAEMSDNGGGEGGPAPGLDASCTANTTDTSEGFQKVFLPDPSDTFLDPPSMPTISYISQAA